MSKSKKQLPRQPCGEDTRGEYGVHSDIRHGYLFIAGRLPQPIKYGAVGGLAIFQGDICLGTVGQMETLKRLVDGSPRLRKPGVVSPRGVFIQGSGYRWPNRTVGYCMGHVAPPNPNNVRLAIQHWETHTNIRFHDDLCGMLLAPSWIHVNFISGGDCHSAVGCQNSTKQEIVLNATCADVGGIIHEIGHAIGLYHEHTRPDRDQFVMINWNNISPDQRHNFEIVQAPTFGPYDYGSIMHYDALAFSSNGQPTIVPRQAGVQIGQRVGLSPGDIATVAAMYP